MRGVRPGTRRLYCECGHAVALHAGPARTCRLCSRCAGFTPAYVLVVPQSRKERVSDAAIRAEPRRLRGAGAD